MATSFQDWRIGPLCHLGKRVVTVPLCTRTLRAPRAGREHRSGSPSPPRLRGEQGRAKSQESPTGGLFSRARLARRVSARSRIVDFFGFFKEHRRWALVIALVNLVGIGYGFYYYGSQFGVTPFWLWWLVPDSPLAVLWAELALIAYWMGRTKPGWLDALAFVGNVQVGLWTCYVLLAYEEQFRTLDFLQGGALTLNTILWVGHLGMAALALIFAKGLRDRARREPRAVWLAIGIAAAYYLVNDVVDYFGPDYVGRGCGLRPYTVPCGEGEPMLAAVTFALTIASVGALAWLARPPARPA